MRHRPNYTRHRKPIHGFTLVELLVVISIIAVLLAILMPSLRKAKEQAKRVVCAGRQRQLSIAVFAYASTYNGYFPPGSGDFGFAIQYSSPMVWGGDGKWYGLGMIYPDYIDTSDVFYCVNSIFDTKSVNLTNTSDFWNPSPSKSPTMIAAREDLKRFQAGYDYYGNLKPFIDSINWTNWAVDPKYRQRHPWNDADSSRGVLYTDYMRSMDNGYTISNHPRSGDKFPGVKIIEGGNACYTDGHVSWKKCGKAFSGWAFEPVGEWEGGLMHNTLDYASP